MKALGKVLSIVAAVLFLVAGILMISQPEKGLAALTWLFALLVLVSGILSIIVYCKELKGAPGAGFILAEGIVSVILGVLLSSNLIMTAFVMFTLFALSLIILGVQWIAFSSACKKEEIGVWWLFMIFGILSIVLGVGAIFNPVISAGIMTFLFGFGFIVHAISLFVATFKAPTIK